MKQPLNHESRESAVYVVSGELAVRTEENGGQTETLRAGTMGILVDGKDVLIRANVDSRYLILGGKPVGTRLIWWNLVSSSAEKLERAKTEWKIGPRIQSALFKPVPGDEKEFIPLPEN